MMTEILLSLIPIMFLIVMGYLLRVYNFIEFGFWLPCEKLNYFYLFPALMFSQVATANIKEFPIKPIIYAILGALLMAALLLWGWQLWRKQAGPVFCSVAQGAMRPNTYIGVAAGSATYGSTGLTVISISIAIAIPLLNVASIMVLMYYGRGSKPGAVQITKALIRNPVILSVVAGLLFNLSGLKVEETASTILHILGGASLPLGLLAVGAGLDLKAARRAHVLVLQSSFVKLLLLPVMTLLIGIWIGMSGAVLVTVVLFNALPCTPSAYIMTKILGGDHQLSAGIISVQTVFAAVTIPFILMLTPILANL